jgi:predicted nucleic acid-binding protein
LRIVIDASVALPWFFADEKCGQADLLLTETYRDGATVPVLWPIEVGNALMMGFRRRRISEFDWRKSLATLERIPITIEPLNHKLALANVPPLAQKYGLTFYDAMYLDLAIRLSLPLATFDAKLQQAAVAASVPLWSRT